MHVHGRGGVGGGVVGRTTKFIESAPGDQPVFYGTPSVAGLVLIKYIELILVEVEDAILIKDSRLDWLNHNKSWLYKL